MLKFPLELNPKNLTPQIEFDLVSKTMENSERLERKETILNLNRLFDEVYSEPLMAREW